MHQESVKAADAIITRRHVPFATMPESAALLEMLFSMIEASPTLSCRARWMPHTLVFRDNRCTRHLAVRDSYPLSDSGYRVSIVGERPAA